MTAEYENALLKALLFCSVLKRPGKPLAMLETKPVHFNKHTFRESKIEKNPNPRVKISCVVFVLFAVHPHANLNTHAG